jgi:hypothetical protein
MDDGEWHTPCANDIKLHELSNARAAYGWCNISKHNTYHDKEVWFNINANTVKIWQKQYEKGRVDRSIFRPIHNLKMLAEKLSEFEEPKSLPTAANPQNPKEE